MTHDAFILMIRKYRFVYLLIFIASVAFAWKFLKPYIVEYASYTSFYISNEGIINPNMFPRTISGEASKASLVQERLNQMVFSTAMQDHLIEKFRLYEHYGYDSTANYAYEKLTQRLSGKIKYDKISNDIAGVRVLDSNNDMAALMANEIVDKLNQMNMEYLFNKVKGNILHNEMLFSEMEQSENERNENLLTFLKNRGVNEVIPNYGLKSNNVQVKELELSLSEATFRIKEVSSQLAKLHTVYKEALNLMDSSSLNSLTVIKKASPDFKSKLDDRILLSLLCGVLVIASILIFQFYYYSYIEDFKIILGK